MPEIFMKETPSRSLDGSVLVVIGLAKHMCGLFHSAPGFCKPTLVHG
jgi:hypothetical protein